MRRLGLLVVLILATAACVAKKDGTDTPEAPPTAQNSLYIYPDSARGILLGAK